MSRGAAAAARNAAAAARNAVAPDIDRQDRFVLLRIVQWFKLKYLKITACLLLFYNKMNAASHPTLIGRIDLFCSGSYNGSSLSI